MDAVQFAGNPSHFSKKNHHLSTKSCFLKAQHKIVLSESVGGCIWRTNIMCITNHVPSSRALIGRCCDIGAEAIASIYQGEMLTRDHTHCTGDPMFGNEVRRSLRLRGMLTGASPRNRDTGRPGRRPK